MNILVTGSRYWTNEDVIRGVLVGFDRNILIHGNCRGVDRIAGRIAKELGFRVLPVPAKWNIYGKKAGVLRNIQMLDLLTGGKDVVLAFHEDITSSKGTKHCVREAKKRDLYVLIFGVDGKLCDEI